MHYTLMSGQLPKSLAAFATNLTNFCYQRVSHWLAATDLSKYYNSGQNLKPTSRLVRPKLLTEIHKGVRQRVIYPCQSDP